MNPVLSSSNEMVDTTTDTTRVSVADVIRKKNSLQIVKESWYIIFHIYIKYAYAIVCIYDG